MEAEQREDTAADNQGFWLPTGRERERERDKEGNKEIQNGGVDVHT